MKISELLKESSLEKEILLAFILKKDRSFLSAFPETNLTTSELKSFTELWQRVGDNEPLAYLLGYKEFFGRNFLVNKNVLIPRPETEDLIEEVLKYSQDKVLTVVDVGTGSGAIAITLKLENPNLNVFATDISSTALSVAQKNAKLYGQTGKITFVEIDLLANFSDKADVIVANLPYIPTKNWQKLDTQIKDYEPRLALDSGVSKLVLYEKLFSQAKDVLKPGGVLFYEVDGRPLRKDF